MKLGLGVGDRQAGEMAHIVINFEQALADVALNPEDEARNISMTNNRYEFEELPREFPGTRLGELVHKAPLDALKAYLYASFLKSASTHLGGEFTDIIDFKGMRHFLC